MPRLVDLQKRFRKHNGLQIRLGSEETLIADDRARMGSGHFIEQKLRAALSFHEVSGPAAYRRPLRSLRN